MTNYQKQFSILEGSGIGLFIESSLSETFKTAYLDIIDGLIEPIKAQHGCLDCVSGHHEDNPAVQNFIEIWKSVKPLKVHLTGPHFRRLLFAMDLASSPPKISIINAGKKIHVSSIDALFELVDELDCTHPKANVEQTMKGKSK